MLLAIFADWCCCNSFAASISWICAACLQDMGNDAILSPEQEEAGLKAREIGKQEASVVEKSQELVNVPWQKSNWDVL